jgi:dTDP-4-amino-4,6-dideoxygalactose transaminase
MSEPMIAQADPILQANPGAGYRAARGEIDAAVARVLASGHYILGPEVAAFEAEFARWLGAPAALGCANGTDALVLALKALGVGPGDAVATVSHTAVATVAAIGMAGATPVLLDVEPDTYTLDPAELAALLAAPPPGLGPVKAVVAVHLYGQPAAIDAICAVAARHGAAVIEDCAQAHGAALDGRAVGSWGEAAAFSFYPTKNLAALGDGGAVATARPDLAARVRALRQYGWDAARLSGEPGVNSRLDEVQAAILRVMLARLDADNARRRAVAEAYDAALADGATRPPARRPGATHVFHQYVVAHGDRDAAQARLRAAGVGTAVHYPVPVHLQPAYRGRVALGPAGCRTTERIAGEILSLPMHPHLTEGEVARVCAALAAL